MLLHWSHLNVFSTCLPAPSSSVDEGRGCLAKAAAPGTCFFLRNSSLRLAFRRRVEGLSFFFFFILPSVSKAKAFFMVSMEKEKEEPMLRENLKAMPWLVNVWQKSRHLMAKVESPTAVIFPYF